MAERLAVAQGARLRIRGLKTSSAGTRAVIGNPIHPDAADVLMSLGGEASDFAARRFTPRVASDADLVLTMTRAHRDAVLELAPRLFRRTFTLTEAFWMTSDHQPIDIAHMAALRPQLRSDKLSDVQDPIGRSPEVFREVGSQIANLLPPILDTCRRWAPPAAD